MSTRRRCDPLFQTSAWRIEISIENLEFVKRPGGGGSGKNGNCFVVELILQDTPPSPPLPSVPFPRKSEPALSNKTAATMRKRKKGKNVWIFGFSMTDQLGQARMPKKKDGHKKRSRACGHV